MEAAAEGAILPARESGRVRLTWDDVSKPAPPVLLVGSACEGSSPWVFSSGHLIASSAARWSAGVLGEGTQPEITQSSRLHEP